MKKLTAATIATVGFATFGIMQGDADAAEQAQTSAYTTVFSQETNDYVTIDEQGNYHHTLDGNWNVSMFEQGLYLSSYTDNEGHAHYVYYDQSNKVYDDNDYTANQSAESIRQYGYQADLQQDASVEYNQSNANWTVNGTDQTGQASNGQSQAVQAQQAPTAEAPQAQASSSNEATSNNETTSNNDSSYSGQSSNKAASGWLSKYPKWQPYGQYTFGGAHYGVDYGLPSNTPVYSFTDGKVIQSGWSNGGGGNQVTIQEANSNNYQWYMHLNSVNVQQGQTVSKGQQIGLSGSTGYSTGPHLHFQRMQGGVGNQYAVNPDSYLANQ